MKAIRGTRTFLTRFWRFLCNILFSSKRIIAIRRVPLLNPEKWTKDCEVGQQTLHPKWWKILAFSRLSIFLLFIVLIIFYICVRPKFHLGFIDFLHSKVITFGGFYWRELYPEFRHSIANFNSSNRGFCTI